MKSKDRRTSDLFNLWYNLLVDLKAKYIFRLYNKDFPDLFDKEKTRLQAKLGPDIEIEHIGSTAVLGLGGKGVIDILIIAPKGGWPEVSREVAKLGYEYKKKDAEREKHKLFFMAHLPDRKMGDRIYHIHLTYPGSPEIINSIGFRDYLRSHPHELKIYAELKKKAALEAQKMRSKDEMRDTYGKIKKDFIEKILSRI